MLAYKIIMNPEQFLENVYAEKLCDPIAWFNHARALIGCARIAKESAERIIDFREKSELENVCSMLYGLSIENILKATWIYKKYGAPHDKNWSPDSEFPKELKTHNLIKLSQLIDANIAKKYEASLKVLSEAAIWSGRYPCSIQGDGVVFRMPNTHSDAEAVYGELRKIFTISS